MSFVHSAVALGVRLMSGARATVDATYATEASAVDATYTNDAASVLDLPTQAIFYANHASHLDFVTVWALLPASARGRVQPVAAADYWGSGWKGRAATRLFNLHLVTRGNSGPAQLPGSSSQPDHARGLRGQLVGLGEILDGGGSIIIFPEGTRGDGERIAPFQPGLARLARAYPEVPIVPVALLNLGRILPKGGRVPVPLIATAKFLAPIAISAEESEQDFLDRARATIAAVVITADSTKEPQQ